MHRIICDGAKTPETQAHYRQKPKRQCRIHCMIARRQLEAMTPISSGPVQIAGLTRNLNSTSAKRHARTKGKKSTDVSYQNVPRHIDTVNCPLKVKPTVKSCAESKKRSTTQLTLQLREKFKARVNNGNSYTNTPLHLS